MKAISAKPQPQPRGWVLWSIPLSVLIHNLEEYPAIVDYAQRHGIPVARRQMRLAVTLATICPALVVAAAVLKPASRWRLQLALAIPALMAANAGSHLAQTLVLRERSPGTITGLGLNIPLAVYLYRRAAAEQLLTAAELRQAALGGALGMVPAVLALQGSAWLTERWRAARADA